MSNSRADWPGGRFAPCDGWLIFALFVRSAAASRCVSRCRVRSARTAGVRRAVTSGTTTRGCLRGVSHRDDESLNRPSNNPARTWPGAHSPAALLVLLLTTRTGKGPYVVGSVAMKDQKWESEAEIAARLRSIAEELRQQRLAARSPLSSRPERLPSEPAAARTPRTLRPKR
jgi:hypothetical protein